jgi:hypothetical protein
MKQKQKIERGTDYIKELIAVDCENNKHRVVKKLCLNVAAVRIHNWRWAING